jgi:hypothetical protein
MNGKISEKVEQKGNRIKNKKRKKKIFILGIAGKLRVLFHHFI